MSTTRPTRKNWKGTRYPEQLKQAKQWLGMAQMQLVCNAAQMTRNQINEVLKKVQCVRMFKTLGRVIDAADDLRALPEAREPKTRDLMKVFLLEFDVLIDKVRALEGARLARERLEADPGDGLCPEAELGPAPGPAPGTS